MFVFFEGEEERVKEKEKFEHLFRFFSYIYSEIGWFLFSW